MHRRKEAAAPGRIRQRLSDSGHHHHEGRQVFVLAAQAIAEPRTHARPTRQLSSGIHEQGCWVMVKSLGVEALHETDIISNRTQMRQEFTHPSSGFAVSGKLIRRGQQLRLLADLSQADVLYQLLWHPLAVALSQLRFGIEEVEVRGATRLEKVNDVLGLGGEVRGLERGSRIRSGGPQ